MHRDRRMHRHRQLPGEPMPYGSCLEFTECSARVTFRECEMTWVRLSGAGLSRMICEPETPADRICNASDDARRFVSTWAGALIVTNCDEDVEPCILCCVAQSPPSRCSRARLDRGGALAERAYRRSGRGRVYGAAGSPSNPQAASVSRMCAGAGASTSIGGFPLVSGTTTLRASRCSGTSARSP
jgi:hypothetical protein